MKKHLLSGRYLASLTASRLGKKLDLALIRPLFEKADRCPLQDPYRIRARYVGWKAASLLIDEKGELDRSVLQEFLGDLESAPFLIDPDRDSDEGVYRHLRRCLERLDKDESIWKAIRKCSTPLCNKRAEEIVCDTLWPETIQKLTTAHVRRAALTAFFTLLRQATGSCFATAPAIMIQEKMPLLLLQDLEAVLSAGLLKRGSFFVPMNPGAGVGELDKPFDRLDANGSPGLIAGFRAAEIPFAVIETLPSDSPQSIFTKSFLKYFDLVSEDLAAAEKVSEAGLAMMWEKSGGRVGGVSPKANRIRFFEKAIDRARRAFCSVADCALLRCWEYTIASFSDAKAEVGRWNLFVSLGLHPEEPRGIGFFFRQTVQEKLDGANRAIAQLRSEHQMAVHQIRLTESLLHSAANDAKRRQLQGEMTAALQAVNHLAEMIDEKSAQAKWFAQFFAAFLEKVIEQLPVAFQEAFDPALVLDPSWRFEDSPAGFRLIFKHGRTVAASWERIENEGQFVDAVYQFFAALERQWTVDQTMSEVFTELMTLLLQFIRSEPFIDGAKKRAEENRPAKNATPWAYQSGGTMETLIQSYFDIVPEEFSKTIRSEEELLQFLKDGAEIVRGGEPFLMRSPTHAFLFYPSWLKKTEPRIEVKKPIPDEQVEFLAGRFASFWNETQQLLFYEGFRRRPPDSNIGLRFRLGAEAMGISPAVAEGFLFESVPLFSSGEAKNAISAILHELGRTISNRIDSDASILTLRHLFDLVKLNLVMNGAGPFSETDFEMEIAETMRNLGLIPPSPILFGDTNWSDWLFGFVPQAESGKLRLWRLSRTGLRGAPMEWDSVFQQSGVWAIVTNRM